MVNKVIKTGDLVEVVRNDGSKFKCVVIENYGGGFTGKVLDKDGHVGTTSWRKYSEDKDVRVQIFDECKNVNVLSEAKVFKASGYLSLNEDVTRMTMTYYDTKIGDDDYVTLCMCEGYGGWTYHKGDIGPDALKESYFNSQISKMSSTDSRKKLSE